MYGSSSFMYNGMGAAAMPNYTMGNIPLAAQGKGKGKLRDSDFEAAFAQFDAPAQETSRIEEVTEQLETSTLEDSSDTTTFKEYVLRAVLCALSALLMRFISIGCGTS
jgi:peroxin-5